MISEMELLSSTCDKQINPAMKMDIQIIPVNEKAVAEMQNFLRAKLVQ